MDLSVAVALIERGVQRNNKPQSWADIGAGDGTFTNAISQLLPPGSAIHALDRNSNQLKAIKISNHVNLQLVASDFVQDDFQFDSLDGVILANALHYAKDHMALLKKIKSALSASGRLIVIEYELRNANPWVPYPVPFNSLKTLASNSGFRIVTKLSDTPSVLNNQMIYSALLSDH